MAVIALLALAGCASRPMSGCPDLAEIARSAKPRTLRDAQGRITASGRGLPENWHNPLEDFPAVRVGAWTYWYEGGEKRAETAYVLGCYIHCCSGGPCPHVYDVPVGAFTLWYPSGRKLGEGTFVLASRHVDTSCEGGDEVKIGRISKESRFWREDGSAMNLEEARASGLLLHGW